MWSRVSESRNWYSFIAVVEDNEDFADWQTIKRGEDVHIICAKKKDEAFLTLHSIKIKKTKYFQWQAEIEAKILVFHLTTRKRKANV